MSIEAYRTGMRVWLRRATMLVVAAASLFAIAAPRADAGRSESCREVRVPVQVTGARGDIAGTLCGPHNASVVQVLVHGYTYGQYYWDLPYQRKTYSYVRRSNAAGIATLNIDRMGTGDSFHPLSPTLAFDNQVDAVHQVIRAVRRGHLGRRFRRVVLVGHSYGSVIAYIEAGRYRDVDAVISTGAAHRLNAVVLADIASKSTPAFLDPKYAKAGYDPGYWTTPPGARKVFYNTANTDPAVIELDEKLKGTGNHTELATGMTYLARQESKDINVPVLTVLGSKDTAFCSAGASDCSSARAVARQEAPYFGRHSRSEAVVVAGAGHDLSLERTAPQTHEAMIRFVRRHLD